MKKRSVFAIHSYLGLVTGLFVLLLSLTGAFITLIKEYERGFHHKAVWVKPLGKRLPYDSLFAIAKRDVPYFHLYDFARFPQKPNEALEILYFPDGSYHSVFINPYSGQIQGYLNGKEHLSRILLKFHWSFFIGSQGYWGALLAFIVALCVIGSLITGLIIYSKHLLKVLTFRERIYLRNWKRVSSSLHRVIGVWNVLFMFVLFGTGAYINYHIITGQYSYPGGNTLLQKPRQMLNISVDNLLRESQELMPGFQAKSFSFPQLLGGNYFISGSFVHDYTLTTPNSYVEFNPQGNIVAFKNGREQDAFSRFEHILFSLHFATYGGLFIKILYCLLGTLSGVLSITGFLLWWRKSSKTYLKKKATLNFKIY